MALWVPSGPVVLAGIGDLLFTCHLGEVEYEGPGWCFSSPGVMGSGFEPRSPFLLALGPCTSFLTSVSLGVKGAQQYLLAGLSARFHR